MRNKLQKLLNRLDGTNDKTLGAIQEFESGVKTLREKLQQEIQASTLEDVNVKINKLRKSVNLDPIVASLENLESSFKTSVLSILSDIETKSAELKGLTLRGDREVTEKLTPLAFEISNFRASLDDLVESNRTKLSSMNAELDDILQAQANLATKLEVKAVEEKGREADQNIVKKTKEDIQEVVTDLSKFRVDFMSRLANVGGGNMNRQIVVGGNPSTLGKYTDINIKAGSNMTITYTNNETTKRTDITFSSSGGGGSVGGTIRSINNISTSQTAGSVAGTDYVYLCTAGIKLDLPPATGNTNLYTVKNVSNSSVLVGGTIDDDVNGIIMPIKYTSVDLISDDTNWNLT